MNIISTLVESLTEMLTGSVEAITSGFSALFFVEGADGAMQLSNLGTFMIIFVGVGCAIGLVYFILGLFRRK